jgi:hypothetical protein
MRKAQPPVEKSNAKAIRQAPVVIDREQADFDQEAAALSTSLGWEGPGENVLDGIQVADAFKFLRKSLHEMYVHSVIPERCEAPTVESVAKHLAIDDEERLAILRSVFKPASE